MLNKNTTAKT